MRVTRHHARWVPPFGHPRITVRLATPRGLSQPTTSFIGSWCQGIHRVLLHTYNTKQLKMLASTVQFSNNTHQPHPHPTAKKTKSRRFGNQCQKETTKPESLMVLFQTPNSVFHPDPTPPPCRPLKPTPVEITTRSCAIVFHPIEPPADPHSGPKPALTLTTQHPQGACGECSLERR